ncbi:MAG: SAM-dependent chlorinase/fluorinase [Desulfurococcales archaeon]|nr:SAM-dependent chlorinase/fluorinase [Desulfurococcales archaeon]
MASRGSALVGLLTDFGWGVYSGVLRALARCLGVEPVDLDHAVPSFSPLPAAYVLENTLPWLPSGSGAAAVVDPGVGSPRRAVLVETRHYHIAAPDNGVAYPAAVADGVRAAYALDPARVLGEAARAMRCPGPRGGWRLSSTFHGRDVFLPAAALAALGVEPGRLGVEVDPEGLARLELEWARETRRGLEVRVVYVDKFGNVALSTRRPPAGGRLTVETRAGRRLEAVVGSTFSDAPPGGGVVYVNSFGYLEVAVNLGSAARALQVRPGDTVELVPED